MESKKINQLATELAPDLSDLTIIGDPTTGISKKITLSQMASLFTGTVEEYANLAAFPLVGTADTIYIALDTNILYRWDTTLTSYVELSPNIVTSLVFSDANGFDGTISLVGSTATLTITTALTTGSVPFIGASGALSQDNANLFFDDTNNRLGINTNAPTTALDAFGSGIIGRLNGTSTNNAFLGFASAGTNKWSIGNVQSDHRFRIYNEATTSELVSVLSTGEFGIGIANPLTKFHIDGGATALIANLDANVSVAKSLSFRSDNSNRINLEVSGTESGSNVGADFFLRTYTDAGSLIETPLTITRSTGLTTVKNIAITGLTSGYLPKANGSSALSNSLIQDDGTSVQIYRTAGDLELGLTAGNSTTAGNSLIALYASNGAGILVPYGTIKVSPDAAGNTRAAKMVFATRQGGGTLTDALTINSSQSAIFSGFVGIGINSPSYTLDVSGSTRTSATQPSLYINYTDATSYANLIFTESGTNKGVIQFIGSTFATTARRNNFEIVNGANSDMTFFTNNTEKMRITSGGNIGIGITTPSAKLDLGVNTGSAGTINKISLYNAGTTPLYGFGISAAQLDYVSDNSHVFFTAATEKMRLNTSGYLGINTTNPGGRLQVNGIGSSEIAFQINDQNTRRVFCIPSQYYGYIFAISVAADGGKAISFGSTSQECGSIVCNTSSLTINYSSDYRLKEDFKEFNGLDILSKVKLYDFQWKAEQTRDYGVIAHELQEEMPNMVTGKKDALDHEGRIAPQGVDYIRFVPILIKAIQEQQKEIEELKAKLL